MPTLLSLERLGLEATAREAARVLRDGGVIVYPTDTVYGLGCDAANAAACDRVRQLKGRPADLSFIVLAADLAMLATVADVTDAAIGRAVNALVPGPVTFILRATTVGRRSGAKSDGTIAVRVPAYPFCEALTRGLGRPIVSTSVNFHGAPPARSLTEIPTEIASDVDLVIDGGTLQALPSTIVDCTVHPVRVVREGLIAIDRLRNVFGELER